MFILALSAVNQAAYGAAKSGGAKDKAKAQEGLRIMKDYLKGKPVSADLIIGLALQYSDDIKSIGTAMIVKDVAQDASMAPLDYVLSSQISGTSNELAGTSSQSPSKIDANVATVGLQKQFSTGTAASLALTYTGSETKGKTFSFTPPATFGLADYELTAAETKLELGVRQSLWKNSLGRSFRADLDAADWQKKAIVSSTESQVEDLLLVYVDTFYAAWRAQQAIFSRQEILRVQNRLKGIIEKQNALGAAEKSDVMQIQVAVEQARLDLKDAKASFLQIWRALVVGLKLPKVLMEVPPEKIPIAKDQYINDAVDFCRSASLGGIDKLKPSNIKAAEAGLNASQKSLISAESSLNPDVFLGLSITANNVDGESVSGGTATSLNAEGEEGGASSTVFVGIDMPLGNYGARAGYKQAYQTKAANQFKLQKAKDQNRIDFSNHCDTLSRLMKKKKLTEGFVQTHKRRVKLDEKRFKLGRLLPSLVITTSIDVATSQVSLALIEAELHTVAWKLKKLDGSMSKYIRKLASQKK